MATRTTSNATAVTVADVVFQENASTSAAMSTIDALLA